MSYPGHNTSSKYVSLEDVRTVLIDEFDRMVAKGREVDIQEPRALTISNAAIFIHDAIENLFGNIAWASALGECYSAHHIEGWGDWYEVQAHVRDIDLIGLEAKKDILLPRWQFNQDFSLRAGAKILLEEFGAYDDPMDMIILYAATRQPELQDREPRDIIEETEDDTAMERLRSSAKTTVNLLLS